MKSFQNRNFNRRLMYSWPAVAVIFLVAVFLGQAAVRSYITASRTRSAYLEVKKDREELTAERADLEKKLDYLSTSYGLERELRRKFGLVKPGERLVVMVDRPQETLPEEKNNFYSLLSEVGDFFIRIFKTGQ
ncbi:MAG: hypothetical protein AAB527_02255 [Patescibacteria group bacterium]